MINKDEVLLWLGHKNHEVPPQIDALIESCIARCEATAKPRSVYRIFELRRVENGVLLESANLTLKGEDIVRHLENSSECAVFAATLGGEVDRLIQAAELTGMTEALILDACANQLIEQYCDQVEGRIADEARTRGRGITHRFSPGYGDFPLEIQPRILETLDAAKKTGLTCTGEFLMIPRKSVTAAVGLI